MVREIKGFSLLELLIVIAIMAIILSIGIPNFLEWIKKYKIEGDTEKIYSFLQKARKKAFAEKIKLDVIVNDKKICFKCDSSDTECTSKYGNGNIECLDLNFTYVGNNVNISKRGTLQGGPIHYPSENNAKYDCIRVSDIRINKDKCNGTP